LRGGTLRADAQRGAWCCVAVGGTKGKQALGEVEAGRSGGTECVERGGRKLGRVHVGERVQRLAVGAVAAEFACFVCGRGRWCAFGRGLRGFEGKGYPGAFVCGVERSRFASVLVAETDRSAWFTVVATSTTSGVGCAAAVGGRSQSAGLHTGASVGGNDQQQERGDGAGVGVVGEVLVAVRAGARGSGAVCGRSSSVKRRGREGRAEREGSGSASASSVKGSEGVAFAFGEYLRALVLGVPRSLANSAAPRADPRRASRRMVVSVGCGVVLVHASGGFVCRDRKCGVHIHIRASGK